VRIYRVLMRAQICFMARPRTPASKMFVTNDPVRELSTSEKAFFTRTVAPNNFIDILLTRFKQLRWNLFLNGEVDSNSKIWIFSREILIF
jgi:hypothetical protein